MIVRDERGFTLPELAVTVTVIIGLCLAALPLVHTKNYQPQKEDAARWLGTAQLTIGLKNYARDHNGSLPAGITGSAQKVGSADGMYDLCLALVPKYLTNIPLDPLGDETGNNCLDENSLYASGFTVATKGENELTVAAPDAPRGDNISLTVRYR